MVGLINLFKPAGMTSRDCVNIVAKCLNTRKVGHAGTLDPIAEGVLVIAVGAATRLIEYIQRQPKSYRGTFLLGLNSPSLDIETPMEACGGEVRPTREQLQTACQLQVGQLQQRPPAYSAVKINGQRAYGLARRGVDVDLPLRSVMIERCDLVSYSYPEFELDIQCGSGTYVRSIARDIANSVGTGAVMKALRREAVGVFPCHQACPITQFQEGQFSTSDLLPTYLAVASLPQLVASESQCAALRQGKLVELDHEPVVELAVLDPQSRLRSIAFRKTDRWQAIKNFD